MGNRRELLDKKSKARLFPGGVSKVVVTNDYSALIICKGYQQMTVAASKERVIFVFILLSSL